MRKLKIFKTIVYGLQNRPAIIKSATMCKIDGYSTSKPHFNEKRKNKPAVYKTKMLGRRHYRES